MLQSQLDTQTDDHPSACAAGDRAAAAQRDPPAGARAAGPPGDPGAARRPPRRPGVRRDAERGARDVAKRNNIPLRRLPQALEQQGIDYRVFRDEMRREIMLQLLRQRDVIARIYVSPRELEQVMARQQNAPDQNAEYDVSHILLSCRRPRRRSRWRRARARARDLRQGAGRRGFRAARARVFGGQHALERGKLGWRRRPQLPQFIADLVAKMKAGDVSEPVRTPTGFHLFRLDDMRGGVQQSVVEQLHARHILMRPNEVQDDADASSRSSAHPRPHPAPARTSPRSPRDLGGSGLRQPRRRSRLDRAGHVRPGVRAGARTAAGERDQRAVPDPVRLAYRPAAGPAHARPERRSAPPARLRALREARWTRKPSCGCDDCATRPTSRYRM